MPHPLMWVYLCVGVCQHAFLCTYVCTCVSAVKRYFLAALRSLKPNCVNHGLCVGDIKPPSPSPASPAGLYARWTHTNTQISQGHLHHSPFIYKADHGRSVIYCRSSLLEWWITLFNIDIFTGSRQPLMHQRNMFSPLHDYSTISSYWLSLCIYRTS